MRCVRTVGLVGQSYCKIRDRSVRWSVVVFSFIVFSTWCELIVRFGHSHVTSIPVIFPARTF